MQEQVSYINFRETKPFLVKDAISLLKKLIAIPSFSMEEDKAASLIYAFLQKNNATPHRYLNNIWAVNKYFDPTKPSILLNSHHDTVRPTSNYTRDPFYAMEEDGKLYGLGSNDAGGALVSLIAAFLHFYYQQDLKYNLIIAATAEEEISGSKGIEALLDNNTFKASVQNSAIDFAIVGEPTLLEMAIAEKGLMVLDAVAKGEAGHAARNEGKNALYIAIDDINWFRNYQFEKVSSLLGPVKMNVTIAETENTTHNIVPAVCKFVVDVRINELYTFEEILKVIHGHVESEVRPRSMRIRSSSISLDHPIVQSGLRLNIPYYGSPTTSDQALMHFPSLKIGPGDSARSHTADEFIYLDEIEKGIETYIKLLHNLL